MAQVHVLGESGRNMVPGERIGFDTLPDQFVNRQLQRGFSFNILVIGETAIGKSTMMETLFKQDFQDLPQSHTQEHVTLHPRTYDLTDGGVPLRLTIVSTAGFADQLDRSASADPIIKYIDQQFEAFLQEELKTHRNLVTLKDNRIHACLYMLPPSGTALRSLDLAVLKRLQGKVNIIPVIAKADTITKDELGDFKEIIWKELEDNGVDMFNPEPNEAKGEKDYTDMLPFAVVGSREKVTINGQQVRVRQYPWGVVEVENEQHSDFVHLRQLLLKSHMEKLRVATHQKHYEAYRKERLRDMGFDLTNQGEKPQSLRETFEQKRKAHMEEMAANEDNMRQAFVQKVKRKEAELRTAEQALNAKFDKLRAIHEEEKNKLKAQFDALEAERKQWSEAVQREIEAADEPHKAKKDKEKKKEEKEKEKEKEKKEKEEKKEREKEEKKEKEKEKKEKK